MKRRIRVLKDLAALLWWLASGGCWSFSNAEAKCERVVSAVNDRMAECNDGHLALDCSRAEDTQGDVDACVAAVKTSACGQTYVAYLANCDIFGAL